MDQEEHAPSDTTLDITDIEAPTPSRKRRTFTEEEKKEMWDYLLGEIRHQGRGKIEKAKNGPMKTVFWEGFRAKTGSTRQTATLKNHFVISLIPSLATCGMDLETRIKFCYAYEIRLDDNFLEELRKNAKIRVNSQNVIVEYVEHREGGLELGRAEWRKMTKEEDDQIIKYLIEDVEKVEAKKDILKPGGKSYWKNFIQKHGSQRDAETIQDRFNHHISPFLHSIDVDTNLLAKLYFCLNIPVDNIALGRLGEHGSVVIDETGKLVSYSQHGDQGLELNVAIAPEAVRQSGRRADAVQFSERENYDMWQYVFQSMHNSETQMIEKNRVRVTKQFWQGYIEEYHSRKTTDECLDYFLTHLVPNLHVAELGTKTKIQLYYALDIPVDKTFLEKKGKKLVVDAERRIQKHPYEKTNDAFNETFNETIDVVPVDFEHAEPMKTEEELVAHYGYIPPPKPKPIILPPNGEPLTVSDSEDEGDVEVAVVNEELEVEVVNEGEESERDVGEEEQFPRDQHIDDMKKRMWEFLYSEAISENMKRGSVRWNSLPLWERFKVVDRTGVDVETLREISNEMVVQLHSAPLNEKQKVILYFTMNVPPNCQFLKDLRNEGSVLLDERACIAEYKRCDDSFELPRKTPRRRLSKDTFSEKDNGKIWNYILQVIKDPVSGKVTKDNPINTGSIGFWQELLRKCQLEKNCSACTNHYTTNMVPFIHLTPFKIQTKLDLYYALQVPVHRDFLKSLRGKVNLELDGEGRIVKFTKNSESAPESVPNTRRKRAKPAGEDASRAAAGNKRIKQEEVEGEVVNVEEDVPNLNDLISTARRTINSADSLVHAINQSQRNQRPSLNFNLPRKSLRQYLDLLKNVIGILDDPQLSDIEAQVDSMIQDLGTGDVMIPMENLRHALSNSLSALPCFAPRTE